jgi:4-amino-4-deoxy-L-arabinose transferase-like glycosyltransferase
MSSYGATELTARRTWLALGLILVLAALVRVLSFRGYTTYDAAEYTRLAHMMVSGEYKAGMLWFFHVFPVRVGLIAPVALLFRTLGVSEVTLTLYPFLLSMVGVALAFFAARAMFGARAGLIAALLMAFLPIDARHASQLLPDLPASVWMNAGVLLAFTGARRSALSHKVVLGGFAGLLLFFSWLCKESVLFVLPFVGVYLVWLVFKDRRNIPLLVAVVGVAGLAVGIEGWLYQRYTGDFLYRFHTLAGNSGAGADRMTPVLTWSNVGPCFVHRARQLLREVLFSPYFAFTPAVALGACAYAASRKLRRFVFPGLWFGWLLLLFGFASASLRGYFPLNLIATRYQYPVLFPGILLCAGLLGSLLGSCGPAESPTQHRRRLLWGTIISLCLAGMSLAMVAWGIETGLGKRSQASRNISRILKPTDRLYTDPHTAIALDFFWRFPDAESTHSFEGMKLSELPSAVYVLINRNEVDRISGNTSFVPPEFLDNVPATWQKLREKDNATLYWVPPSLLGRQDSNVSQLPSPLE